MIGRRSHKKSIFIFLFLFSISAIRYPVYLRYPNFYAEDGTVFFADAVSKGLLGVFDTFNGYPIFGVRLLANLANFISLYPFTHNLEMAALVTSILAIAFWTLFGYLTVVVVTKFSGENWGLLAGFLIVLTPINGWNYAILGVLGNLKFGFFFLGFLLLLSRWLSPNWTLNNKILLLLCFFTNPLVIIYAVFFVIDLKTFRLSFNKIDALFLMGLYSLAALIFSNALKYPLPSNYKNGVWSAAKYFEVSIGRSFFFPILSNIYHLFSFTLLIVLSTLGALLFRFVDKEYRSFFLCGFVLAGTGTAIILFTRGGLSEFFTGFNDPGPAQFFYSQNMIVITTMVLSLSKLPIFLKASFRFEVTSQIIIAISFIALNSLGIGLGGYGINGAWQISKGDLNDNEKKACLSSLNENVRITIMPGAPWSIAASRKDICPG